MRKPIALAAVILPIALLPAGALARDHTWWPIHGPDAHRIFIASGKAASVRISVCARHLAGADAVEVLRRYQNGSIMDDVMVIGAECKGRSTQLQQGQTVWIRLRRGSNDALAGDKGRVRFNVMPAGG